MNPSGGINMTHNKLRYFVTLSALCAIVFVLGMTPLGIIPIGFINVTILCIPVIVGTVLMGLKGGLVLGACFGLSSTLRAFGIPTPPSALVAGLMAESPFSVIVMSMLPRLCVPVVTWLVYRLITRRGERLFPETPLAKVADSIIFIIAFPAAFILLYAFHVIPFAWTLGAFLFFIGFELIFAGRGDSFSMILSSAAGSMTNTVLYLSLMLVFYKAAGIESNEVLALIKGTGIIAGGLEAMAAAVLTGPIVRALKAANLGFKEETL